MKIKRSLICAFAGVLTVPSMIAVALVGIVVLLMYASLYLLIPSDHLTMWADYCDLTHINQPKVAIKRQYVMWNDLISFYIP